MNFFEAQEEARRRTRRLAVYFVFCVFGVVVAVEVVLALVFGLGVGVGPAELGVLLVVAGVGTVAVILLGSLYKSFALRRGGAVVAEDLGGRRVLPDTRDFHERRLLNVVEEMAIASGTPVPQVFIMDGEEGINAFAAGTEPSNAVIGVTRGCVERLGRAELQGVVAHEFSHILNGDMRLNMRLIGMVFGLVLITLLGRILFQAFRFMGSGRSSRDNSGMGVVLAIVVVGLVLMLIGSLGSFFARLLQAAVSRQREFLADASAVQFTRDPSGISGALKKIGGQVHGSKVTNARAVEASHLFFADGGLFAYGLATHPPLPVRIRAIEKDWNGEFLEAAPIQPGSPEAMPPPLPKARAVAGVAMLASFGEASEVEVERGRAVLAEVADEWRHAVEDRTEARALLFGLLVAEDDTLRGGELAALHAACGPEVARRAAYWHTELRDIHSARKIALLDLSMPTLRGMSEDDYWHFVGVVHKLIESDGRVTLFEYMIYHLLRRHLASHFEPRGFPPIKFRSLAQLGRDVEVVLSALAREGRTEDEAQEAWAGLVEGWPEEGAWRPNLLAAKDCHLSPLGRALESCEAASPLVQRSLLGLGAGVVARDGILSNREIELLRLVADGIGCGVPPVVGKLRLG